MLGVSRNTVMNAYERLFADGFLETRVGDGTYITLAGSGTRGQAQPSPPLNPPLHAGLRLPIAQQFNRHIVHDGLPSAFRIGLPALDLFPFETWSRLQNRFGVENRFSIWGMAILPVIYSFEN